VERQSHAAKTDKVCDAHDIHSQSSQDRG
jgi:hypothetical protein